MAKVRIGGIREQWIRYEMEVLRKYPDYQPEHSQQVERGFIGGAVSMLQFFTEKLPRDRAGQETAIREMREELQNWSFNFTIDPRRPS